MRKKLSCAGLVLVCALTLTACTGGDGSGAMQGGRQMAREWLGSGEYQADGRGRVGGEMSRKGRDLTEGAESAVDEARQGAMDAGRELKRGAERAGQDLERAAGK